MVGIYDLDKSYCMEYEDRSVVRNMYINLDWVTEAELRSSRRNTQFNPQSSIYSMECTYPSNCDKIYIFFSVCLYQFAKK